MRSSTTARTDRSEAPRRLRSAGSDSIGATRHRSTAVRLVGGAAYLIRRFAEWLAERRRRRRSGLHAWMTMDPRLLADIGVRRSDVHAAMYAGVPIERLGARPTGRPGREVAAKPCGPVPGLRLVVADNLDEAA